MTRAHFTICEAISDGECLVIEDDNDGACSVTNDAEAVVEQLTYTSRPKEGQRLEYYDTDGRRDELLHDGHGKFLGFAPAGAGRRTVTK